MMTMNGKQHFSMHPALHEPKYPGLHSGSEGMRRVCLPAPQLQGNIFGGFDESLLARAEALAAADSIVSHGKSHPFKPDVTYHTMSSVPCTSASSSSSATVPISHVPSTIASHHHHHHHHLGQTLEAGDLLDHLSNSLSMTGMGAPEPPGMTASGHHHHHQHPHHHLQTMGAAAPGDGQHGPPSLAVRARRYGMRQRRGVGSQGAGSLCRAVQAEEDQARGDAGRRRVGTGQPQDPRRGLLEPEHHLQVRVPHVVPQQHDSAQAGSPGLAGGGGGCVPGEEHQAGPFQREREEKEAHLDRRAGEALVGGVLCYPAAALLGKNCRHRRKTGPEKECGPSLVL
uniref:POU class 4 homeobox 3 n=1 Tax=Gasterosteus aculeatus aculeatus TaxID=481459 RepID=A0AAQ4P0R2_GASAC